MLNGIDFHLINPTESGNIGACARALKNMGFDQLHLLEPHAQLDAGAFARASGADDLLLRAQSHTQLNKQLSQYHWVVGTTMQTTSHAHKAISMEYFVQQVTQRTSQNQRIAVLFGTESSGLTNQQLDHCQATLSIPCSNAFSSLNLSHAVQIIAYEARKAMLGLSATQPSSGVMPATHEDIQRMVDFIEQRLTDKRYLAPEKQNKYMRHIKNIFHQSQMSKQQAQLFMGMLRGLVGKNQSETD